MYEIDLPTVFVPSLTAVVQDPAVDRGAADRAVKPQKERDHIERIE